MNKCETITFYIWSTIVSSIILLSLLSRSPIGLSSKIVVFIIELVVFIIELGFMYILYYSIKQLVDIYFEIKLKKINK